MARSGINKKRLASYGGEVHCFMSDEDVAKSRKGKRHYKSRCEYGKKRQKLEKRRDFLLWGNAPTALIELDKLIKKRSNQIRLR